MLRTLLILTMLMSVVLAQHEPNIKCGFSEQRHGERLARVMSDREFDYLDESIVSPSGYFRIHFTRNGVHSVLNAADPGTPNFVLEAAAAADSAYNLIVNELGFQPPVADGGIDGDELDIYIVDMKENYGSIFYGMTTFPGSYSTPYTGLPTYLEIDNDYVESQYATNGLAALRVTIAHEFFHMVQLRYSYPFAPHESNPYWYEISSTWMEEKCYPEVNDYHAYVADNFFQTTFPNLEDASSGYRYSYGHGLFGQILDIEYGYSGGKHIMLDLWESLGNKEATDNLESVLKSSRWNSSLTDALGKYALYNVFTGSRAIPGEYYEDAVLLPEIRTSDYVLPSTFPTPYEFVLEPLQMGYKRFNAQSMSKIYIRGEDLTADQRVYLTQIEFGKGASLKAVISNPWIECDSVSSLDYFVFPMVNSNRNSTSTFKITFQGDAIDLVTSIQSLWPNPSVLGESPLYLNLMLASPNTLRIKVYNIQGQTVFATREYHPDGIRILDLQLPDDLPAGVYIIQIRAGRDTMSRKFTVLK